MVEFIWKPSIIVLFDPEIEPARQIEPTISRETDIDMGHSEISFYRIGELIALKKDIENFVQNSVLSMSRWTHIVIHNETILRLPSMNQFLGQIHGQFHRKIMTIVYGVFHEPCGDFPNGSVVYISETTAPYPELRRLDKKLREIGTAMVDDKLRLRGAEIVPG